MRLIIAEKPSVGRSIASIVEANVKKDGYYEGGGYIVSWALGHLCRLKNPDEYNPMWKEWNIKHLPMFPEQFDIALQNDSGAQKQFYILKRLIQQADEIVNAGDAGREGELIQRWILQLAGNQKRVRRLWISSLTDTAIREGMKSLKDSAELDNLYLAAKARAEADWLVGMNGSRALCLKARGTQISVGRVQTPTLAIVCRRFLENRDFKSMPYWNVIATTAKNNVEFELRLPMRYMDKKAAETVKEKVSGIFTFKVLSVTKSEKKEQPPLLFDLTGLQKAASVRLFLTAEQTLNIAQKLYEAKYITYPRTSSQYISEDIFQDVEHLMKNAATLFSLSPDKVPQGTLSRRSVNNKKVTDHHALLMTEVLPDIDSLSKTELSLYKMIVFRVLEAFSKECIKDVTKAEVDVGGEKVTVSGSVIKYAGWRAISGKFDEDNDKDDQSLPSLTDGDILPNKGVSIKEGKTLPPPLLTDATLLAYMETAGKECADESEREAMKECGLGTPATRAAIIEKIIDKKYIERKNNKLLATELGLQMYEAVKGSKISSPELTGQWEKLLYQIEHDTFSYDKFISGVKAYTTFLINELQSVEITIKSLQQEIKEIMPVCPKCKKNKLHFFTKGIGCDTECGFVLWNVVAGKKLSNADLVRLVETGKTNKIKGFKRRDKKTFEAVLKLTDDFKITIDNK